MATDTVLIILAYLLGSLSSAVIVCRLAGLPDPRSEGSRNPGATNVLRYGGKRLAALVLCGDTLKGLIPVLAAKAFVESPTAVALIGLAAFAGHLYPLFFGFRGGKGVATSLGVILGLSWILGALLVAIWLAMAGLFRISSLAALSAAFAAPFAAWLLVPLPPYVGAVAVMSIFLAWRHRGNIEKLLRGQEPRIGNK